MTNAVWMTIQEAAPLFGMSYGAIMNQISAEKFPCPSYKLGRRRVMSREVVAAFFQAQTDNGLAQIEKSTKS